MVTFFCKNCRFKYTPKTFKASPPLMCHNCGAKGSVEKEPDAEQILRESTFELRN